MASCMCLGGPTCCMLRRAPVDYRVALDWNAQRHDWTVPPDYVPAPVPLQQQPDRTPRMLPEREASNA